MTKANHVVITGAAGFIGGNLTRYLHYQGLTVTPLVLPGSDTFRLNDLPLTPLYVDITDYQSLLSSLSSLSPDQIIHCATYGVYRDQQDSDLIFNVNVNGTRNLLNAALELKIKTFINTGSVYEYADLPGKRVEEITGSPRNMYDTVKIITTNLVTGYAAQYGLSAVTLRLFTAYGPYEDSRRLIPSVLNSIKENKPPQISPRALRDFVYIDDLAEAYCSALKLEKFSGQVVNLGSGQPTRVADLVASVISLAGSEIKPVVSDTFNPVRDSQCYADIKKAQNLLHWQPRTELPQGLKKTIAWHQHHG